jgi:hypothetical protein
MKDRSLSYRFIPLIVWTCALLCSCSGLAPPATREQRTARAIAGDEPAKVAAVFAWHDGTLPSALARARREHKLVLVVWCARWAPSCEELTTDLFRTAGLFSKLDAFVPFYLNPDDVHNQQIAAELRISATGGVAPTLVILNGEGEVVTHVPRGLSAEGYVHAFDATLRNPIPLSKLIGLLKDGSVTLNREEWEHTAYNLWYVQPWTPSEGARVLTAAATACPTERILVCGRITSMATSYAIGAIADLPNREPDTRLVSLLHAIFEILGNRDQAMAAADLLKGAETGCYLVANSKIPGIPKEELGRRWRAAMLTIWGDSSQPGAERVSALASAFRISKVLVSEDAPQDLADDIAKRFYSILEDTRDRTSKSALLESAMGLLSEIGQPDRGYHTVVAEFSALSGQPYFALLAADYDLRHGNIEAGFSWIDRGYESATGSMSRARMSIFRARMLMAHRSSEFDEIAKAVSSSLGELDTPTALHGDSADRIEQLYGALKVWVTRGGSLQVQQAALAEIRNVCDANRADDVAAIDLCKRVLSP